MATLELTLPNGRRMRLTGPTREAVQAQADEIVAAVTDPEMGSIQLAMLTGPPPERTQDKGILSTPFGQVSVGGRVGSAIRALGNVREEQSVPVALATMGALAAPARIAAAVPRAAPLAQRAVGAIANALRPAAGAGVGGAVAGAGLEAENPDATAGDIARRAVVTGGEMAAAELAGLGIGKAAQAAFAPASVAPALRVLDPVSEARKAASAFARDLPARMRAGAKRIEEMLPESIAAGARDIGEGIANVASRASEVVSQLARQSVDRVPDATRAATRVRSVLGDAAERIGADMAETAPGQFISRVFEKADSETIGQLRRRLGSSGFRDALSVHLSSLIDRASSPPGVVRLPGRDRALLAGDELVTVDAKRLDEMWSRDSLYLQRGAGNARGYPEKGVSPGAEAPEIYVSPRGVVSFVDGRHRARALIDQGVRGFTVTMERESVENARRLGLLIENEPTTLNGTRLLEEWRKLPEAVRKAYPQATQKAIENLATMGATLQRMGKFAGSTVGGEILEATAIPAIGAVFGPQVAVPIMVAKALLSPGPLTRYLTRDKLPNDVVRAIGSEGSRLGLRAAVEPQQGALTDDEYEMALDRIIANPEAAGRSNRARLEMALGRDDEAALRAEINAIARDPRVRGMLLP